MTGGSGGGEMAGMSHYAERRSHRVSQLQSTERGSNKNKCPHITQLCKLIHIGHDEKPTDGKLSLSYI